jgi:hypothetical protein
MPAKSLSLPWAGVKAWKETEVAFGEPLEWERLEGKRACRIMAIPSEGFEVQSDEPVFTHSRATTSWFVMTKAASSPVAQSAASLKVARGETTN